MMFHVGDEFKPHSQEGSAALGLVLRGFRISVLRCFQTSSKERHGFVVGNSPAAIRRLNWRPGGPFNQF